MTIFHSLLKLKKTLFCATFSLGLIAAPLVMANEEPLKVGVTVGPHAQIGEVARQVAEKQGLQVKLIEFSDFIQPNAALDTKDIDLNIYQHRPFMNAQNSARGYKLVPVANAVVQLMGIYSSRHQNLEALPDGATIAIPNDPSNGARALLVLQATNLIKIKEGVSTTASLFDIVENPKKLKFIEIEAAQLPHSLKDVDAAAVNSAYAIPAGLDPAKDALALEDEKADFAVVVIAAREDNKDDPRIARFIKAYQSDDVKAFVEKKFPGAYFTAW